jgi:type I restriction enzyme S subunit
MSINELTLDELGTVARGRSRHRPRDAAFLYGGPHPFVQTGDVKKAGLYLREFDQTYSEAGLAQSKLWPIGTLCITVAANIAETSILDIEACFPDSVIGFIADPDKADTRFVKYLFDAVLKMRFKSFTQGAAQDNLSQGKLLSIKFPVPELNVQMRVADILSAYDDLMEHNLRRIALLEETARLLYREWFVHFRFPGHEHVKIINSLPQGWTPRILNDVVEVVKQSVKPSAFADNDIHIGLEHIPRRSFTLSDWEPAKDLASGKTQFLEGDILFCKIRPYFHKVGFALRSGLASSDAIVWRVKEEVDWPLVVCATASDHFVAVASKTVREGSKMPRADWNVLKKYPIPKPGNSLLKVFNDIIFPITAQCKTLALQNRALREARDLLLPRLMNGEIAV